jgi:hypothetical protein
MRIWEVINFIVRIKEQIRIREGSKVKPANP